MNTENIQSLLNRIREEIDRVIDIEMTDPYTRRIGKKKLRALFDTEMNLVKLYEVYDNSENSN